MKLENLLSDINTFQDFTNKEDPLQKTLKIEDRLNRFLKKLKLNNNITETEQKDLYVSGSDPGILYGLPKIHKANTPIRQILSSIDTPSYKLAKFLIPHIDHLAENEYALRNSKEFFDVLSHTTIPNGAVMASFDIESLYTNIPIGEAIEIIANRMYEEDNDFKGLSKKNLHISLKVDNRR